MVDIYEISFIRKTEKVTDKDFNALKYATIDDLAVLMILAGVHKDQLVIFQDKHSVLKTSNLKWSYIVRRVVGTVIDNIKVFTESGKIRDSGFSIEYIRNVIIIHVQTIINFRWYGLNKIIISNIPRVTGVYRLFVFISEKFEIVTTYPWRHSTDNFPGTVYVILNCGEEERSILVTSNKTLIRVAIWYCLEFVAGTPQSITA
ncbi:hypothetical protein ACJMK2_042219 [Sinanodonta woodiana]|uniref:Uncharacterized protein n=1 Tax=Sinanodonta woodiana TaxID=1069815 RepID=A0ABD3W7C3_SINWO